MTEQEQARDTAETLRRKVIAGLNEAIEQADTEAG